MTKTVSVVGLGYVGLPTAALFAASGCDVIGLDVDEGVVETVNDGRIHIVEPELSGIVHSSVAAGRLRATTVAEPADVFMIAVPTPVTPDNSPDLSFVRSAATKIAPELARGNLVVLESTSPVGTTRHLAGWLADLRPDLSFPQVAGEKADVQIAYCPERVLPGHVVRELVENDRIIGGMTQKATKMALSLYALAVQGDCIATTAETAEMCKLVENSSRDVQIAFANEVSMLCDKFDVNVWDLIALANRHPRVNILQPGAGVGGHCVAVDPWFLVNGAPDDARLIHTARKVNDAKPKWIIDRCKAAICDFLAANPDRTMGTVRLACLGLSFKPNIDELRESPALEIVAEVSGLGCQILAVEPHIDELPNGLAQAGVTLLSMENAIGEADVICVLVKHSAFQTFSDQVPRDNIVLDFVGL